MSGFNCCFLACTQILQELGLVTWYSHLFKNFPQFVVTHTVKGFSIVNEAESESEICSVMPDFWRTHVLYSPWNSPHQNAGVGSLSLLQGIFPTQWLNPGLLHCKQILYQPNHKGSPRILEWVAFHFSRYLPNPGIKLGSPAMQADSFPTELWGRPYDPRDFGNLLPGSSAFSKSSLNIWKSLVHILLKLGLENFEYYFSSMWSECNCAVVWTFFGIALLWDWNENWSFPVLWPLLSFPYLLAYWVQHFNSIIFVSFIVPLYTFSMFNGEGNDNPLQYSCLENPMDGGTWWAAVHGATKSRTRLRDFTFTFQFHALEKEMATHSSILVWRIPGTGEPGGLPSMESCRVGHDWSNLAAAAVCLKTVFWVFHWLSLTVADESITGKILRTLDLEKT